MDGPRYRIDLRRPDGTDHVLARLAQLTEVNAVVPPRLIQLADGREAGTVLVVDQHAEPESAVVGSHDIGDLGA